ncbi:polyribonucleotide 5'-hydroxyl-kinase [Strigomonas culicis]|nr:polyribonucleotide 5'-hydroxyl-kinase [Strigomonas culicis]|eukprot:EPY34259.1 polyribonucleotide 5'-hydroxyl-kinase [Strigomonas culicis]
MVIGAHNTGKTTLCRTLVNLGVKLGQHSIAYIDVNVDQQSITCPGSVSASFIEAPVSLDEGFGTTMPLSFFFGDTRVDQTSRKRYLDLCAELAHATDSVARQRLLFSTGGAVINTMGSTAEFGIDLLMELCSLFAVTDVVVCGSDAKLENDMYNAVGIGSSVSVMGFPKYTQMLPRDENTLAAARDRQLASYFIGTAHSPLLFARQTARVDEVSFLHALTLRPLAWNEVPVNRLAAVVWADTAEQAASANVAGFVVLFEVGKSFFSFASPSMGPVPKPFLLVSPTLCVPVECLVAAKGGRVGTAE